MASRPSDSAQNASGAATSIDTAPTCTRAVGERRPARSATHAPAVRLTRPVRPTTTPVSVAAGVNDTPNQRWNSGTVKVLTEYEAMFEPTPASTIHHTVGTEKIRLNGRSPGPASAVGPPTSAAPRRGSFTKK